MAGARKQQGQILIQTIVFGAMAIFFISGMASWAVLNIKATRQALNRELAIQIAEAGIDYYRWHLAHAPLDFQDGAGAPGPYTHNFQDKFGNVIGKFILEITPPPDGSTLVTIKSTGKVNADLTLGRSIAAQLAKPSVAKYTFLSNSDVRFGVGSETFGQVHSNGGIHFDGLAHNLVSSALDKYQEQFLGGPKEFAVHTHLAPQDPFPPASVPERPDVFAAGRQFPVPAVDFAGMIAGFAQTKSAAEENGFYRPSAGALGYHIVLKTDDTFDLYRATGIVNPPFICNNALSQPGWGTWSISAEQLIGNYPFPANGIIFLEDDVFVDGQIDTARLTIVAAFLPENPPFNKNIIVNRDLLYTNYDGQDAIGLIAQGNVIVGMVSDDDLRIDAALIAKNGRVQRYYYRPPSRLYASCSPYHTRQKITLYGMVATNLPYGFSSTDGFAYYADATGYITRSFNYDANLLYGPPPNFPLTSEQYTAFSWKEE